MELSLILPTFQEAQNIHAVLRAVSTILASLDRLQFEIIVVDDNSADGTAQLALDASATLSGVRVIRRVTESGLSTAVIRGWQAARGEILGVMDADLQHPPEVLSQLVQAIRSGADVVVGSRHVEEGGVSDWSFVRRIISRTAQLIGLVLLPEVVGQVTDPMSGYFLLRRRVIAGRELNPTGYKILIEVLARGNAKAVTEVGYVFRERRDGRSKVSAKIYLQYLQHLLRLRIVLLQRSRFVRFCVVGLSGIVIDTTLLFLLGDPTMLAWGLTRSKILAAEAAMINNFYWNDMWTFADRAGNRHSLQSTVRRFIKFHTICFLGLVLNIVLLNIQFNLLGVNRYVANCVAVVAVTLWNYWINDKFGWRSSK